MVSTQGTLASIRHSIDNNNEFYNAENDYWDEYVVHVDEQGGYHAQDFPFDEDEMACSAYPLEVYTIED